MSKKINIDAIQNELKGSSSFFQQNEKQTNERTVERSDERTNVSNEITNQTTRKRIRHTFDIYEDQLMALHETQLKAVQQGNSKPKLGDMVQEALDDYLKKNKR